MVITLFIIIRSAITILGIFLAIYPSLKSPYVKDDGRGASLGYLLKDGGRPDSYKEERKRKIRIGGSILAIFGVLLGLFIQ